MLFIHSGQMDRSLKISEGSISQNLHFAYSIDISCFEAYNPSIMAAALSERQRDLINPFNASWVADVTPVYGTEDPASYSINRNR